MPVKSNHAVLVAWCFCVCVCVSEQKRIWSFSRFAWYRTKYQGYKTTRVDVYRYTTSSWKNTRCQCNWIPWYQYRFDVLRCFYTTVFIWHVHVYVHVYSYVNVAISRYPWVPVHTHTYSSTYTRTRVRTRVPVLVYPRSHRAGKLPCFLSIPVHVEHCYRYIHGYVIPVFNNAIPTRVPVYSSIAIAA